VPIRVHVPCRSLIVDCFSSVMSLDRYLTLRYPLKYGRNKRRSLVAYKITTIWLISFAICLPLFVLGLVNTSNVYNEQTHACFPAHRTFKIYGSFVAFFIPLIIMIVTYALTMSALQQAHTTKRKRYKRREKMHAVINLAAMAIRWKRAVNVVEIPDEQRSRKVDVCEQIVSPCHSSSGIQTTTMSTMKRDEATLDMCSTASKHRTNDMLKPFMSFDWQQQQDRLLKPLSERSSKKHEFVTNENITRSCSFVHIEQHAVICTHERSFFSSLFFNKKNHLPILSI
jgi:hypothetical protein